MEQYFTVQYIDNETGLGEAVSLTGDIDRLAKVLATARIAEVHNNEIGEVWFSLPRGTITLIPFERGGR